MKGTSVAVLALLTALACQEEDASANYARGRGLQPASVSVAARAQIYRAAVRSAFDVGPGLVLQLHPRLLPRESGLSGGEEVSRQLVQELRRNGTIQGTCEPADSARTAAPRCDASSPGYIVRFSDVLQLGGDSVEVYLNAEQYGTTTGPPQNVLRFEKAYQLVKAGDSYRVVREGRVPEAVTTH